MTTMTDSEALAVLDEAISHYEFEDFDSLAKQMKKARAHIAEAMRDAGRLDWLMAKVSGKELRDIGVHTFDECTRECIDAAMKGDHA